MKARRDGLCQACASSISRGDDVVPIQPSLLTPASTGVDARTQRRGGSVWIHAACASSLHGTEKNCQALTVCKHWQKTGACMFGAICTFAHPQDQAGTQETNQDGRSWQSIAAAGGPVHLHATGIPLDVDMQELMKALEAYGEVLEPLEVRRMKRHSAGWAVVKYAKFEEAKAAVDALNGKLRLESKRDSHEIKDDPQDRCPGAASATRSKEFSHRREGVDATEELNINDLLWESWEEEEMTAESASSRQSRQQTPHSPVENGLQGRQETEAGGGVLKLWFAQLKRKKIRNEFRVAVFRRWLLDTFGAERLAAGSGVLDVAGGKGELSFELVNLSGIRSTVVEPRPLQLGLFVRRLRMGLYHRNQVLARYNAHAVAHDGEFVTPPHLRIFFEDWPSPLYPDPARAGLPTALGSARNFERGREAGREATWSKRGLHEGEKGEDEESGEEGGGGERGAGGGREEWERLYGLEEKAAGAEVVEYEAACHAVAGASAVVGMHPDQAAQPIVRLALALGKPFACVPCCVYSHEAPFRTRRLKDGRPVTNYDTLIQFLCEMDDGIQVAVLPFEGKNKVLYHLGRDVGPSKNL